MLVATVAVTFVALTLLSLPIVFALGLAGFAGLLVGNFSLTKLPLALVAGSQSWVLLAVFGWQVSELNSQSYSPALDLNLRWLYLSSVVGGILIVVYSVAALADVWRGVAPGAATER